tara:strand:+ start:8614 stop:11463 length:2850 start_codon:yes stop_codon:yes gene_type:complete
MGTERDFKVKKGLKVENGDITVPSGNSVFAGTFNTNVAAARLTLSGTTLAALGDNSDININITPKNNGNVVIDGAVELGHASDTTIARASSGVISVEGSNVIMASNDVSALSDSTSAAIGIGTIELGHASDTTIARSSAGVVTIEGAEIRTGTVPVSKGGTGTTSLTNGGVLLGSGTGAITATAVLGDGEMLVGDGTTDPAIESGATLRTSIGVGTGDSPTFTNLTLSGDLTLDDGGSLKEAGGTAAITFDGSGHITKLGQSSPSTNDVLKYDGAKWVADSPASGADGMGSGFVLEDGDGTEVTVDENKEVKFIDGSGMQINWTNTSNGTDADPYALTFSLDVNALSAAAIASGDFLAFSDASASNNVKKESIDDIATLFAGTGLTASSAVISVDAAQTQITSVGALTGLSTAADATIDLNGGAITIDGTTLSIDSTDTTNLTMTANSSSGKTLTIDAANSGSGAASIAIGTTSGTSISIGHTTSTVTVNDNLVVTGDLTINGATTTVSTTNSVVEDSLIELNTGATSNSNDLGFIFERGSTGNNAAIIWDESADKFAMGTTTNTGADTGNLTVATGTLVANIEGNLTGTVQTASQTNITGVGTITTGTWNATDIAVAHGGTGASSASDARTNLGLAIGSDVQAFDAQLTDVAGLTPSDGGVIIGDGANFVVESGNTLRASLGLGISNTPRFTGIELGAPADTTLTRASAGDMNIEGNIVYRAGGTNVAIADGGTNADNASDARDNLGLTIGTNVQAYDDQLATLAGYSSTQIGFLNVSTAGAVEASKAVVVDSDKDIESFRNLTATGVLKSDGMQLTGGANSAADSGTVVAEFDVSEAQLATNTAATIASYAFGTYRTAKFLVQIGRVDSSEQFDSLEIMMNYDGGSAPSGDSDIFMTTYGYVSTGTSDLGTFNAVKNTSSNTIDLQFTPATSGGTYEYRVVKSLLIK